MAKENVASQRFPDAFASFLDNANQMGQSVGIDMPLMARAPAGMSQDPTTTGKKPPKVKQHMRVRRFVIDSDMQSNETLDTLLDKIANKDDWFLRQQREQIMNDGSIVVLVSYMTVSIENETVGQAKDETVGQAKDETVEQAKDEKEGPSSKKKARAKKGPAKT